MTLKQRQEMLAENLIDGRSSPITAVAGLQSEESNHTTRRLRITIPAANPLTLAIDEGDDYGSVKLCDLPDKNLMILGVEIDLELVKGEVTNGLEAATDVNFAVGSAAASNSTLSGAMIDVIDIIALTATDASPAAQAHSQANTPANMPLELGDGASNALYLNAAAAITANDALTITGTVDIYYIDLGNVTS